ncbi:MAG: hypothetical protein JNM84_00380 [Planctomycetes bacterium]|nr:hypothetical protein [Planctomycetota bacterium]
MRSSLLCVALAALPLASAAAQSPLRTLMNGTRSSRTTSAVFFDLEVRATAGVTLAALELHIASLAGTPGHANLYLMSGSYLNGIDQAELWAPVAASSITSAGLGATTLFSLADGVFLAPGIWGLALVTPGLQQRTTLGVQCSDNTTPGACANSSFSNAELVFRGGAETRFPFVPPVVSPLVWNGAIHYQVGAVPNARAERAIYGMGGFASLYRSYADSARLRAELEGRALRFTPDGDGYRVALEAASYWPPSAAAALVFALPVDDHEVRVPLSQPLPTPEGPQSTLYVHSNGIVTWGTSSTTFPGTPSYRPTGTAFLNGNHSGFYAWHDFNETEPGSGRIVFEEVAAQGRPHLVLTWDGVEEFASPERANPSTLQVRFDLASGEVVLSFVHLDDDTSTTLSDACIVGFAKAGPSYDPEPVELEIDLPLTTCGADLAPHLDASLPELGSRWTLSTLHFDPTVLFAFQLFGSTPFAGSGLDLAAFGAPGQRLYVLPDLASVPMLVQQGFAQLALPIPAQLDLVGATLYTQTVAPTSGNALGWALSAGLVARVGF